MSLISYGALFRIVYSIIFVITCLKWGDWRNWKKYYPTILFFAAGDLIYNFVTYSKPLWQYGGFPFNHTIANLYVMIIVYPSLTILYITHYPKKFKMKVIYISLWAILYTSIEYISYTLNSFYYYNGWNILYSFLYCIYIFSILRIHYKKPLIAWTISIGFLMIVLYVFNISFENMK